MEEQHASGALKRCINCPIIVSVEIWGLDEHGELPPLTIAVQSSKAGEEASKVEGSMWSRILQQARRVKAQKPVVSDLIFRDLQHLHDELRREHVRLRRQHPKLDDADSVALTSQQNSVNKRLLYLFQRDLLPGLKGAILDDKSRRDSTHGLKPHTSTAKHITWLFIGMLDASLLFYVLLFAMQQSGPRQRAWAQSFGLWLVMEVLMISTMMVVVRHVLMPLLLMKDVAKIQRKLTDNLLSFYQQQMAKNRRGDVYAVKDEVKQTDERDNAQSFNAAHYLFLSYRLAQTLNSTSSVAQLILHYQTPWPKQSYQHQQNVKQGYSRKFAAIGQSISLIVLFFLSSLLTVPMSIQDMVVRMVTTVTAGYTLLVHMQLYKVYPVLIVVPSLCVAAIVHFLIQSSRSQAQIRKQQLMQRIRGVNEEGSDLVKKGDVVTTGEEEKDGYDVQSSEHADATVLPLVEPDVRASPTHHRNRRESLRVALQLTATMQTAALDPQRNKLPTVEYVEEGDEDGSDDDGGMEQDDDDDGHDDAYDEEFDLVELSPKFGHDGNGRTNAEEAHDIDDMHHETEGDDAFLQYEVHEEEDDDNMHLHLPATPSEQLRHELQQRVNSSSSDSSYERNHQRHRVQSDWVPDEEGEEDHDDDQFADEDHIHVKHLSSVFDSDDHHDEIDVVKYKTSDEESVEVTNSSLDHHNGWNLSDDDEEDSSSAGLNSSVPTLFGKFGNSRHV